MMDIKVLGGVLGDESFEQWLRRKEKETIEECCRPTVYPGKTSDKEIHADICSDIHNTFIEKNARYGDSFSKQFEEFGMVSLIIRLSDKLNRLKTLTVDPDIDVLDESIEDSLKDLANYAIMGLVELDKKERGVK